MTHKLVDIRCACGKLLGKVQEGAAHEIKCPRCKCINVHQKIYRFGDVTTESVNPEAFKR